MERIKCLIGTHKEKKLSMQPDQKLIPNYNRKCNTKRTQYINPTKSQQDDTTIKYPQKPNY